MHLTLTESHRSLLQAAECTFASLLAHAGVVAAAIAVTTGGPQLPADEREARVFFLLPPDRVDVRARQTDILQWGRPGGDLEDGKLLRASEGMRVRVEAYGARARGQRSGARGELPFGPVPYLVPDTVFSVLEVDEMVERYDGSAAPAYPPDLMAMGTEGSVRALYVVDTTGWVDTATIRVLSSDDERFTQSVRAALGAMRFRPAKRAGRPVRQLVEQKFSFRMRPVVGGGGRIG
ncbi:MAG TPA: energy transducer TonB [Gemmatimonadales bacterium]|nr:energy transducer TonB [Gemmatimonadales bacterium]